MQLTIENVKKLNDMMNNGQTKEVEKIIDSLTVKEQTKLFEMLLTLK